MIDAQQDLLDAVRALAEHNRPGPPPDAYPWRRWAAKRKVLMQIIKLRALALADEIEQTLP